MACKWAGRVLIYAMFYQHLHMYNGAKNSIKIAWEMFLGPESLQENQGSYTYSTMLCKGLEGKDIMIYMIYLKK